MIDSMSALLNPTARSLGEMGTALLAAKPRELLALTVTATIALYIVLRPIVTGFKLKRLLLNTYPTAEEGIRSHSMRWSSPRATGLYRLEDELFGSLHARRPLEIPLDLIVSSLILLLPLASWAVVTPRLIVFRLTRGQSLGWHAPPTANFQPIYEALVILGLVFFVLPAIRLAWLLLTWWQRTGRGEIEAAVQGIKFADPLLVGLAQSAGFLGFIGAVFASNTLYGVVGSLSLGIWATRTIRRVQTLTGDPPTRQAARSGIILRAAMTLSWAVVVVALLVWVAELGGLSYLSLHPELAGQSVTVCEPGQRPTTYFGGAPLCTAPSSPVATTKTSLSRELDALIWSLLLAPFVGFYYLIREINRARARFQLPASEASAWHLALSLLYFPVLAAMLQKQARGLFNMRQCREAGV
jgi:hypothetical protein